MAEEKTVVVELCRSNSIGDRFYESSVIGWWRVSPQEASEMLRKQYVNGYYLRVLEGTPAKHPLGCSCGAPECTELEMG